MGISLRERERERVKERKRERGRSSSECSEVTEAEETVVLYDVVVIATRKVCEKEIKVEI